MSRAYQLALLPVIFAAISACGSRDEPLARRTQEFEVVEEGAVAGVTSTISAPGEAPAPLLPPVLVTDTNADTTTSFAIIDPLSATSGNEPPGTLADTLPEEREVVRPRPRPVPVPPQVPPETTPAPTETAPTESPSPSPAPPPSPSPPPLPETEEEEKQPREKPEQDSSAPPPSMSS